MREVRGERGGRGGGGGAQFSVHIQLFSFNTYSVNT